MMRIGVAVATEEPSTAVIQHGLRDKQTRRRQPGRVPRRLPTDSKLHTAVA